MRGGMGARAPPRNARLWRGRFPGPTGECGRRPPTSLLPFAVWTGVGRRQRAGTRPKLVRRRRRPFGVVGGSRSRRCTQGRFPPRAAAGEVQPSFLGHGVTSAGSPLLAHSTYGWGTQRGLPSRTRGNPRTDRHTPTPIPIPRVAPGPEPAWQGRGRAARAVFEHLGMGQASGSVFCPPPPTPPPALGPRASGCLKPRPRGHNRRHPKTLHQLVGFLSGRRRGWERAQLHTGRGPPLAGNGE
mmetsp:Transcript_89347/g.154694  ORF Transcript_89347/g.154694 Transcript_89347/m.154694 type:complete len:242 (+) Transcript_89347:1869-2594(+)